MLFYKDPESSSIQFVINAEDYFDNHRRKNTPATCVNWGILNLKPSNVLLSHGETPHYHRR